MASKHEALKAWIEPFLTTNYLYFESADAYPNVRVLVPNYGDYINGTDIVGRKYKSYSFVFIAYERIDQGTSDVNIENMNLMDTFTEWLEAQIDIQNYPDFGDDCSEYEIVPLQNMANLATIDDDNLAKYMLGVRIDYIEFKEEE